MNWQKEYDALYDAIALTDKARLEGGDFWRLTRIREYLRTQAQLLRPWPDGSDGKPRAFLVKPDSGANADTVSRF
jgi:hypothetical protein